MSYLVGQGALGGTSTTTRRDRPFAAQRSSAPCAPWYFREALRKLDHTPVTDWRALMEDEVLPLLDAAPEGSGRSDASGAVCRKCAGKSIVLRP